LPYFGIFLTCPECGSKFREGKEWSKDEYIKDYFEDRKQRFPWLSELTSDYQHYQVFLISIGDVPFKRKWNIIHSLGGGFPKLESILKPNKIIVYDICAEEYMLLPSYIWDFFKQKYQPPQIIYKDKIEDIEVGEDDLITACHFFEHLEMENIIRLLKSLRGYLLIYQPNPETFYSPNWFFAHEDHISLLSPLAWERIFKEFGWDILYFTRYSEDQCFFVFKGTKTPNRTKHSASSLFNSII